VLGWNVLGTELDVF